MLRTDASAGAEQEKLPPEEVKLYAQRVSCEFHPWAELQDVCAIVDAKARRALDSKGFVCPNLDVPTQLHGCNALSW